VERKKKSLILLKRRIKSQGVDIKIKFSELSNTLKKNGYLKILIGCLREIMDVGGWLRCNHFRLSKRALALSISNRTTPF
jgi:hypothetical protein